MTSSTTANNNRPAANAPRGNLTASLNGGVAAPSSTRGAATPPNRSTPARPIPTRNAAGQWAVQVGAFRDEAVARNWLAEINRRFRTQFSSAERTVQSASGWYRSRFTGLTEANAQAACSVLSERRVTCAVIRPEA
jgi:D-alanyl-D-alanine carboxypeptidase (penicillin-binding protein 5/6)